ncbi:MAG: cytochrome P450 [Nitrososphaeraceae archaeon]
MERSNLEFPPGPSSIIPGKIIRQFARDPISTLTKIADEYGDISHFKLGRQHVYLINNPDYIEKILIYDHSNFKKGPRLQTAKRVVGEGLVTSEGEFHKKQRKLIQPLFLPKKISSYGVIMTDRALGMIQQWKDGSIVNIHAELMKVTLSIICKSVMNYEMESKQAKDFAKAFSISKKYSSRLQHPVGHVLDHVPILPKVAQASAARKTLDSIVYGLISERRKEMKAGKDIAANDLLSRLIQVQDEDGSIMSDKQLRDEIITILIAGHETTSNALTWTYYLLSQNPQVEKKVFEEIDSVFVGNGQKQHLKPSVADLPKLKYVEKVFREAMRIYPPVWSMGRFVEEDYSLGIYTIPKGSSLLFSQYVMHHNSKYYNNPESFHPDRWTEEFKMHLPRFSYFPFGGGIRGCIGEPFAWQEGILLIATISSYWSTRLAPNERVKLEPGITLNPKKGIKMRLRARR